MGSDGLLVRGREAVQGSLVVAVLHVQLLGSLGSSLAGGTKLHDGLHGVLSRLVVAGGALRQQIEGAADERQEREERPCHGRYAPQASSDPGEGTTDGTSSYSLPDEAEACCDAPQHDRQERQRLEREQP